jgi:S-methylmethionine transporter
MIVIFLSNAFSVRFFAETEFWFASIKVLAIVLFIGIGLLAILRSVPRAGIQPAASLP